MIYGWRPRHWLRRHRWRKISDIGERECTLCGLSQTWIRAPGYWATSFSPRWLPKPRRAPWA